MNEELSWNWGTLLEQEFWIDAAVVLGVTIVCYLVLRTVLRVVANRLGKLAGNARGSHARILASPPRCFAAPAACWYSRFPCCSA